MPLPGTVGRLVRAPCRWLAGWVGGVQAPSSHWHGGSDPRAPGPRSVPSHPRGGSDQSRGSSIRWSRSEAAVGSAGELPAAVVDGPMMGPADQGQVVQVGGAAIQPMPHMMGLTPGQGTGTAVEDTATVADSQGAALGRADHPGGPADIQGSAGGATQ